MLIELPLSKENVDIKAITDGDKDKKEKCVKCESESLTTINPGSGLHFKCLRCSYIWAFGGDTTLLNTTQKDRETLHQLASIDGQALRESYLEGDLDDWY
jgi:hypothetical protein